MPEAIEITRSDETTHGSYRAELPGVARPAELTWRAQGPLRIANHTFVPPEMRGRALAMVGGGMTIAFVLGIPMGTIIGSYFSWRAAFAMAAGLANHVWTLAEWLAVPAVRHSA